MSRRQRCARSCEINPDNESGEWTVDASQDVPEYVAPPDTTQLWFDPPDDDPQFDEMPDDDPRFEPDFEIGGSRPIQRIQRPKQKKWSTIALDILWDRHQFQTPELKALYQEVASWSLDWTKRELDPGELVLDRPIGFGTTVTLQGIEFTVALGGLHSVDVAGVHESDEEWVIIEVDATSDYPNLLLGMKLTPGHIDRDIFLEVYKTIKDRRVVAKESGNSILANGLKVPINGVFGQLIALYSKLLDPIKGAAITINGQLLLLRLIEAMGEVADLQVISANTDGVMVKLRRRDLPQFRAIIKNIEAVYEIPFEEVEIVKICREHVNSFVLSYLHTDKKGNVSVKTKARGNFNDGSDGKLERKIRHRIAASAATQFLLHDTPIEQTIRACTDIREFTSDFKLGKGYTGRIGEEPLTQQLNRWYEGTDGAMLVKIHPKTGAVTKFSNVQRAVIVNDLPDQIPNDLNYPYYVAAAQKLVDLILTPQPKKKGKGHNKQKNRDELNAKERAEWKQGRENYVVDWDVLKRIPYDFFCDEYTGLTHDNYYDGMQRILKTIWTGGYGATKAELLWLFEAFDSGVGHFKKAEKYKDIMGYIGWMLRSVSPIDKELFEPDETPIGNLVVKYMDDECGSGKTRALLEQIVTGGPGIYWWAISTIDPSASERKLELDALMETHGVKNVRFHAIHSRSGGSGTMRMQINTRWGEISTAETKNPGETIWITLVTQKTLMEHYLSEVRGNLVIDEAIQAWAQMHYNFITSYRTIRGLFTPQGVGPVYDSDLNPELKLPTQAARLQLSREGARQFNDPDMKNDDYHGGKHRWIIEQAGKTSGRVYVLTHEWNGLQEDGDIDVLTLLHPLHVSHFDSVTMLAAHFQQLMVYQLWSDLYDVTWEKQEIVGGWERVAPLKERVVLYHVLRQRDVNDNYLYNKGDPARRKAMATAVSEFFADIGVPFIWSVNAHHHATGDYAAMPGFVSTVDGKEVMPAYLTPKQSGVNGYSHLHGAAWLGSIKIPTNLLTFMERIWGQAHANAVTLLEYELYQALQFLTRINSRRFDSNEGCVYVVADTVQANYIAKMCNLPPEQVLPLPMRDEVRVRLDDIASKGRGRKGHMMSEEDRRERARKKKAKQREQQNEAKTAEDRAKKRSAEAKRKRDARAKKAATSG